MSSPKGISILIPIYNVDIRTLVQTLDRQGQQSGFSYEIICFDDFSSDEYKAINKEIQSITSVQYKELPSNIGRSKIRNLLAVNAHYSHLLFLDCDSSIPSDAFLSNYINYIDQLLVVGGRNYHKMPPSEEFILHWTIGKVREERNAKVRNASPYQSFMSNNFLIKKDLYLSIQLDEKLKGYGHEDTKFGYELGKEKTSVLHIDNPVIHEELDPTSAFLNKTKEGIKNFYKITEEGYGRDTKLYKSYSLLRKSKTTKVFLLIYSLLDKKIEKNLQSSSPSLICFDLFKLNYLVKEANHN